MADAEVCTFITKVLCAHGGRLAVPQLLQDVKLPETQLRQLMQAAGPDRFLLLDISDPSGVTEYVVATARVRVCRRKVCHRPCGNLHLCKLNLLHRCHYSERNLCKYSHEIFSADNIKVLDEHELWGLNEEELTILLLQNDPFFLPEICKSYKGENRKQICLQQPLCERLHICEHFTRGDCSFPNCLRSHNLMDRKVLAVMKEHGLSADVVQNIQDICNSKHGSRKKSAWKGAHRRPRAPKGKGQNREEPFQGSLEFLSTSLLSPPLSHSPSPEPPGSPLDEVSDLTSEFQHLGSQEGSPPASISSKLASVRGPGLVEGSQRLLENGGPRCGVSEDSSSCGLSDADPVIQWKGPPSWLKVQGPKGEGSFPPAFSSEPSAPTPRPRTFRKNEVRFPSEAEIWKNESILVETQLARDLPSTRPSSDRDTAIMEREKASPRNPDPTSSQKNKVRLTSEIDIWKNGGVHVDAPVATHLPAIRPSSDRATAIREREKTSLRNPNPRPSQKSKDGSLSDLETWKNRSGLDVPPTMGLPSTRPLHNKATAVQKVKSWDAGHKSPTSTCPSISGSTAEQGGFTAKDHNCVDEKDEICLGFLSQGCPLPRSCKKVHFYLPYQWQILNGNTWEELQPLETIEKEYCDPQISIFTTGNRRINFSEMTCNSVPIRRISTCSSVRAEDLLSATKWIWYWRDKDGAWIEYGKQAGQHQQVASVDSSYLENLYCYSKAMVVPFQAGEQKYELNFQAMVQTNITSRTQKKVLRRPAFVSAWDMEQIKRELKSSKINGQSKPLKGNPLPQEDSASSYQLLELSSQDLKYAEVSKHFKAYMKSFKIDKIKEILNTKLKDAFNRKKMEKQGIREETLFCIIPRSQLASICANNFDCTSPRHIGSSYGMGSYFTKDASRSYKESMSSPKLSVMIMARVLVGNYMKGNSLLKKPPPMFDSCVDSIQDPSVFVIFEKDQIYPQYVIEFSEGDKSSCVVS